MTAIVPSSDGVELALHDLGGVGPELLISHATGFHGRCYLPIAHALADRHHCVALDYRGHGDSTLPDGVPIEWSRYGDDAEAVVTRIAATTGAPVRAFGHSMGGACLLMAAARHPESVDRLVVFEPIVFPPSGIRPDDGTSNPLAAGARRRRSTFASHDDAILNFSRKPPLGSFTPEALDAYVRYGFAPGPDGHVHLKCLPETEAATFDTGGHHATWDQLPQIHAPVLVISGRVEPMQPSSVAERIAELLPNAEYLQIDDLDHFGPMTDPARIAELIAGFVE